MCSHRPPSTSEASDKKYVHKHMHFSLSKTSDLFELDKTQRKTRTTEKEHDGVFFLCGSRLPLVFIQFDMYQLG